MPPKTIITSKVVKSKSKIIISSLLPVLSLTHIVTAWKFIISKTNRKEVVVAVVVAAVVIAAVVVVAVDAAVVLSSDTKYLHE